MLIPACTALIYITSCVDRVKAFPQGSHLCSLKLLCACRACLRASPLCVNVISHISHLGASLLCTALCLFSTLLFMNTLLHMLHFPPPGVTSPTPWMHSMCAFTHAIHGLLILTPHFSSLNHINYSKADP